MQDNSVSINDFIHTNKRKSFDILQRAIRNNVSFNMVEYIASQYKSLNYINNNSSPLLDALSKKRFDIADFLLKHNANINKLGFGTPVEALLRTCTPLDNEIFNYVMAHGINITNNGVMKLLTKSISNLNNDLLNNILNQCVNIENTFNTNLIPEKRIMDLIEIFKRNDLEELQNYVTLNIIELDDLNSEEFDILTIALEYRVSVNIIKFIISKCHYSTLNYEKDYYYIKKNKIKIPLFMAVAKNDFSTAELLLEKGANINMTVKYGINNEPTDIVNFLYSIKCLNNKNLKFILNHDFIVIYLEEDIIMDWIDNIHNTFLEIFLSYCSFNNNTDTINFINDYFYYDEAMKNNNYNALYILYNCIEKNYRGKYINLWKFYEYLNDKEKFLNYIKGNSIKFKYLNFYYNSQDYDEMEDAQYEYINETKYQTIKSLFQYFFKNKPLIYDNIRHCITFLQNNKNDEKIFENYLIENKIKLNELNTPYFDILLFALEIKASDEIIQMIIRDYQNCQIKFNYSVKEKKEMDEIKSSKFKNPFIAAVAVNKFKIANLFIDLLSKENLSIIENSNEIFNKISMVKYFYSKNMLNNENLIYILTNDKILNDYDGKNKNKYFENLNENYNLYIDRNLINKKNKKELNDYILDEFVKEYNRNLEVELPVDWIKKSENIFLEIYLYYEFLEKKCKLIIDDKCFYYAYNQKNYNGLLILLNYDHRNSNLILYKLFKQYDNIINLGVTNDNNDNDRISDHFIYYIKNNEINFANEKFYYNLMEKEAIKNDNNMILLDENKYYDIKMKINKFLLNKEKREKINELLLKKGLSKDEFEEYINENKIILDHINTPNFDVLILAIKYGVSNEIIKFIINQYVLHCGTFNYGIDMVYDRIKTSNTLYYLTPLLMAIGMNNFEIADLLIKYNAEINYDNSNRVSCYSHETFLYYEEDDEKKDTLLLSLNGINVNDTLLQILPFYVIQTYFLNTKNLKYLISKEYNKPLCLLKCCLFSNNIYNNLNNNENLDKKKKLIDMIFYQYFYDNDFILMILNFHYKNRKPLSKSQLKEKISKERSKLINKEVIHWIDDCK
eukprot:jgi/Orpsp1_1/1180580/evm.model.c7180000073966.1